MEAEIRRVKYFDGQFLKEQEFNEDGSYYRHMRRRLNYVLFDQSGVLQLEADDLTLEVVPPATGKQIRIKAGTAVSLDALTVEGKEFALRDDTLPIDLAAQGVGAGDTAWATVSYEEVAFQDEPSDFGGTFPARVREQARWAIFATLPAPGPDGKRRHPVTNEELIVLGNVVFNTMLPGTGGRQVTHLRTALLSAGPAPTITSVDVHRMAQGSTGTIVITGSNLVGASAVTFSGTAVSGVVAGSTLTTVTVNVTVSATATVSPRDFTVVTPGGSVSSTGIPAARFQVVVPLTVAPSGQMTGSPIVITGTDIRDAAITPVPAPAVGTVVRFLDPFNPAIVRATPTTVEALANSGSNQRLRVTIPAGTSFTPTQPAGSTSTVKVQTEFRGETDLWTGTLTVNF